MKNLFVLLAIIMFSFSSFSQKLNIEPGNRYFYFEKPVATFGISGNTYDYVYIIGIKNGIVCCTPTRYDKTYHEWFNMDKKFYYPLAYVNAKMAERPLPLTIVDDEVELIEGN